MTKDINTLLKEKQGIRLDIGCGASKQRGFVGIDYFQYGEVDIVHNVEVTPWPLPDECVLTAISSHLLEHLDPHAGDSRLQPLADLLVKKGLITQKEVDGAMGMNGPAFMRFMDEVWRVLKPGGQFAFVVPHAASPGYQQDPTHVNMINETTLMYFDPLHGSGLYQFYRPKPWKIEKIYGDLNGLLEVILSKRPLDRAYTAKGGMNATSITDENIEATAKQTKIESVRMG
jgi:SAM-dependent methyltransferase